LITSPKAAVLLSASSFMNCSAFGRGGAVFARVVVVGNRWLVRAKVPLCQLLRFFSDRR
jgi:hypothetical protein